MDGSSRVVDVLTSSALRPCQLTPADLMPRLRLQSAQNHGALSSLTVSSDITGS